MKFNNFPLKQGLYDPGFEHDSCGVGFVCNIKGEKSNKIVRKGLSALKRLSHRGAVGADPKTGDGAGILIQTPHDLFLEECKKIKINLPPETNYGTGLVFLPNKRQEYKFCKNIFSELINQEGQTLLGWRKVPINNKNIGKTARITQPIIEQPFIKKNQDIHTQIDFERKLYVIRKQIENKIRKSKINQKSQFYITTLSSRTFLYKGLLTSKQLESFFLDLKNKKLKSSICLIHARYSTNTFPTWDLAQPFRFLAHNGEINTLRGNINWMKARQGLINSIFFKNDDIEKIKPIIVPNGSDSAVIDNVFELLSLTGRSLSHSIMMLIPEAWENNKFIKKNLKNFYQYHTCFMEPWDGPAAIAFTDGKIIGAILDRNGLRPARYIITKDNLLVMASEVGVLDIPPEKIKVSGRLEPGKIFFVNTEKGCVVNNDEIKNQVSTRKPYGKWLNKNLIFIDNIETKKPKKENLPKENLINILNHFGYTREDINLIIKPMSETAKEPIGSMGNDTPHAVLSKKPQLLYNYFKQLFAQVTNPAIDPIREKLVMSLESYLGSEKNILDESPQHCQKIKLKQPIITDDELEKIKNIKEKKLKTKTISILFRLGKEENNNVENFKAKLNTICKESIKAIQEGFNFILLSDKGINKQNASLPALLATSAIHHYLVKNTLRTQVDIIVETGEPREVHHFALLLGYGANLVNPYLVYSTIKFLIKNKYINLTEKQAIKNYIQASNEGILKILSKMGISTLQSYRGSQIFEALGINKNVIEKYFCGTTSRIEGIDLEIIAKETLARHMQNCIESEKKLSCLQTGGIYKWKKDGEFHSWNPETIAYLQDSVRKKDYQTYKKFANSINNQLQNPTTLRNLFQFKKVEKIPLSQVEPAQKIVKRFATGAMSFGSISKETHQTIAIAMNRLKAMSNTGEGGEDPKRFKISSNKKSLRSSIKQVASGRFGVTTNYLINADELQIKIAQGAKPGEGGHLPGHKVSEIIARTRYTTPGVTLISPPPHHDIYSIEDLAQLIFDLKNVNPYARISVKLVSEIGVGTIAAGVAKGHADMILISGGDGGTGASPKSSIRHAGLPWELGLAETHQTLLLNNLRHKVSLQTDGQIKTGKDVAIAAMLGAEEFGFSTSALIVLGCVMLRHCHLNNCALGIATQDEMLRKRFTGKPEFLVNYAYFVAEELREIMANLGINKIENLIGRTDLLEKNKKILDWKTKKLDFKNIFYKPTVSKQKNIHISKSQDHEIDKVLDRKLIRLFKKASKENKKINLSLRINNTNRTVGAMLSGEICKLYGENALPKDTIKIKFQGVAGQSFGAFLVKGINFKLEGIANDYVGKGLFGGKLIIYPNKKTKFKLNNNTIIGNTSFYGAIRGEAYIRGLAGERFCIRNSGITAVVEGIGDHGCEYMTGGKVMILGKTGRNFAAGMSGGIAYIYDEDKRFNNKCNTSMVELEKLDSKDKNTVYKLLCNHYKYTKSPKAKNILDNFNFETKKFIKVIPIEYKKILRGRN